MNISSAAYHKVFVRGLSPLITAYDITTYFWSLLGYEVYVTSLNSEDWAAHSLTGQGILFVETRKQRNRLLKK